MTEGAIPHIIDSETLRARLRDHNVVVFQIDNKTGKIKPLGDPTSIPSPSCIMIR